MAVKTVLSDEVLAGVCETWGLGALRSARGLPEGSINTLYVLETARDRYVLRLSEGRQEAEVAFETALLAHLETHRYPAVRLVPRLDGKRYGVVAERYACVFRWAAGESVRGEALTPEHVRDAGRLMARLHVLTEDFDATLENRNSPAAVREWVDEITRRAAARPDDEELRAFVPVLRAEAAELGELPPAAEGVVHADWFPDNVRHAGSRVAVVLDFEMACRAPYVLDLAIGLDANCFGEDGRFDVPRVRAFVEGYVSERPLSLPERRALWRWARFAALRFTCSRILDFHLSPLPPEQLARKDWRRFRDRLRETLALGEDGFLAMCGLSG